MAAIKPKRKSVIQAGSSYTFNPATFDAEHKMANSFEVFSAQEMIEKVKPFEFMGMKLITFDTEAHPIDLKNHDMPKQIVRRWIGSGKSAVPIDLPFCISICDGVNAYTLYDSYENRYEILRQLAPLLEDESIDKIAHNTKFDMHMLANAGIKIRGRLHDTIPLAKLANENRFSYALVDLARKNKRGITIYEDMVDNYKKLNKVTDYRQIPKKLITDYANADVWNCFVVFIEEYTKIVEENLVGLYNQEMDVMLPLWMMERYGMSSVPEYKDPLQQELQELTDAAEQDVYNQAGKLFNINSSKQLYDVLLEQGVSPTMIQMTDKGNPSLDKKALDTLGEVHGVNIVVKILEYRKYEKLLNTYAIGIYDQADAEGLVHGSINQTEATTGRMSIVKPALQTLPKKDKRIRRIFKPCDEDYELYLMDLDQIEYRLFAHYAQALGLIDAIKKGLDIHRATAAIVYGVPYEEVTDEQRTRAKTINFSLIYGQGDDATAVSLKMPLAEARRFKATYFANLVEAKPFIDTVQKVTRTKGYVTNFYKRRRRLKTDEVYKAVNALIQSCAADYLKSKIVLAYKYIMMYKLPIHMINVVHDEVIFDTHKSAVHHLPKLRYLLSDLETFRVPITAGLEKGNPTWGDKVTVEDMPMVRPTDEEYAMMEAYNIRACEVFDIFVQRSA